MIIKIKDFDDFSLNIKIKVKGFKKTKMVMNVGTVDEYDMILYEGRVYVEDHKGRDCFIKNLKVATGTSINNIGDLRKYLYKRIVEALLENKKHVWI